MKVKVQMSDRSWVEIELFCSRDTIKRARSTYLGLRCRGAVNEEEWSYDAIDVLQEQGVYVPSEQRYEYAILVAGSSRRIRYQKGKSNDQ